MTGPIQQFVQVDSTELPAGAERGSCTKSWPPMHQGIRQSRCISSFEAGLSSPGAAIPNLARRHDRCPGHASAETTAAHLALNEQPAPAHRTSAALAAGLGAAGGFLGCPSCIVSRPSCTVSTSAQLVDMLHLLRAGGRAGRPADKACDTPLPRNCQSSSCQAAQPVLCGQVQQACEMLGQPWLRRH